MNFRHKPSLRLRTPRRYLCNALVVLALSPALAQASMFKGEVLDTVANIMSWVVLIVAPAVGIAVFWLVHILPEKIAEQRQHPQAKAIQTLCLLSLAFGGLLWPLAWLWAYTKPVLYQMAYGTDRVAHGEAQDQLEVRGQVEVHDVPAGVDDVTELRQLRERIGRLEARLAGSAGVGET